MTHYMLLMYNPVDEDADRRRSAKGQEGGLSPEDLAREAQRWASFTQDLKDAGVLIANNGLQGAEAATTVRVRGGETEITDGPFAETKELLAGYFLIEVPDLDTALRYAAEVPSAVYGSVEVRPIWG